MCSKMMPSHVKVLNDGDDLRSLGKYYCTGCQRKPFRTAANVRYHWYCDGSEKPFICPICDAGFVAEGHFKYHLATHTGERNFVCDVCGKSYISVFHLSRHKRGAHTGGCVGGSIGAETAVTDVVEVVIRHSCGLCFAKFYTNEELHRHMALNHLGGRPCLCEVCGLEVWNLRGHQAAEHFLSGGHVDSAASTGRRFVCSVGNCSVRFEKKTELRRHLSFAHGLGGSTKPKCGFCGSEFTRLDNMKRHMRKCGSKP